MTAVSSTFGAWSTESIGPRFRDLLESKKPIELLSWKVGVELGLLNWLILITFCSDALFSLGHPQKYECRNGCFLAVNCCSGFWWPMVKPREFGSHTRFLLKRRCTVKMMAFLRPKKNGRPIRPIWTTTKGPSNEVFVGGSMGYQSKMVNHLVRSYFTVKQLMVIVLVQWWWKKS